MAILRNFHAGSGTPVKTRQRAAWAVCNRRQPVVRLDLATGHIAARGPNTGPNGPDSPPLTVAAEGLWYTPAAAETAGAAVRLDPVTLAVTARTTI
jgi:hypothetical protein